MVKGGDSVRERQRGREAERRRNGKGIMGRNGSTCHPTENYDSSFSAVAHSRVSCGTFKALDLRLQDVCRVLLLYDTIYERLL